MSAGAAGGAYLNATGTLATTALQTLTLGTTTTGNINIGTDATARTLTIGNETGATSLELDSGTGAISIGNAIAKTVNIGNATGASLVNIDSGTGGVTIDSTGAGDIALTSGDDFTINMPDNSANGFDLQQGTDNYINVTTADSAEAITIGNSLTNLAITLDRGSSGSITLSDYLTCTALETNGSGVLACGTDDTGSGGSNWRITSGGLSPVNDTLDLLIGNSATASAKFGVLNINSGTPTATISANSGNNATYLSGTGTLSTTNAQTLTIGGSTTGNITIDSGSSSITLSDNTTIVDNNWIGFGGSAGRIEFDDQTTDEVNIISANVGIGTQTPTDPLNVRSDSAGATSAILRLENLATATVSTGGGLNYYANRTTGGSTNIIAMNGVITSIDNTNYAARLDLRTAQAGALTTQASIGGPNIQFNLPIDVNVGGDVGFNYDVQFLNTGTSSITSEGPLSILAGDINHAENLVLGTQGTGDVVADINDAASTGGFKILGSAGYVFIANPGGNTGIGILTPSLRLDVQDTQSASAAAQIFNTNTGTDADGMIVKLGNTSTTVVSATNHFISFETSGIGIVGSVRGGGGTNVDFRTTGIADFAEYLKKDKNQNIEYGSTICIDEKGLVLPCENGYTKIIGVSSNQGGFTGGKDYGEESIRVGFVGQVYTRVANINGAIKPGDPLSSSSIPGVAVKAVGSGQIVGKALEEFNSDGVGKILVSVNVSWYDPTVYIAGDGNLNTNTIDGGRLTIENSSLKLEDRSSTLSSSLQPQDTSFDLLSSTVKDLSDKVGLLEGRINNLAETSFSASTSAFLSSVIASGSEAKYRTVPGEAISTTAEGIAEPVLSGAKDLSRNDILDLGNVDIKDATISGTLAVLGRTTLTDLGVTGNINAGLLSINGLDEITSEVCSGRSLTSEVGRCVGTTINTLSGSLYLQSLGLGGIDILAGKITIDTKGNVKISGDINVAGNIEAEGTVTTRQLNIDTKDKTAASIGSGILKALETYVTISSTSATENSKIFITSTTPTGNQSLYVRRKTPGVGFVVAVEEPYQKDIVFDWWIVN